MWAESNPPSSTGVSGVQLEDCIEELLKCTLISFIEGEDIEIEVDVGLSKEYCSSLVKLDAHLEPSGAITSDIFTGVPAYPLYKQVSSALYSCLVSRTFYRKRDLIGTISGDDDLLRQKEEEWIKLILDKCSDIANVLRKVEFEFYVQEPFFSQLKGFEEASCSIAATYGLKTVQGRCAVGNYSRIASGTFILFNRYLILQVEDVHQYASFKEMLEIEGMEKVLPGVKNIEDGVQVYRKFYTEEKESLNGVLAIYVKKTSSQLYIPLASILSGLSYEGIQRLLGFLQTPGTIPEALPPPRSTLISTFLNPHNPLLEVKSASLTVGARALTKHANRSKDSYWGSVTGSDKNKNMLAREVINNLMAHSCWLNLHVVQPHGVVFEIRLANGYGARWSGDGTKFIGFLEPYMTDGHSKGWKH